MPKYLWNVSYGADGVQGLLKEGGSARRDVARQLIESLGGRMEAFYFTFGIRDAIVIADLPDTVSAVAMSLAVSASGSVAFKTTLLITPAEIDQAAKKRVGYRRPGGN